jgi:large subunit ribosomal protein L21
MEYAIISTGGKQYKVGLGQILEVEKLTQAEGKEVRLKEVLAVRSGAKFEIGQPTIKNASVLVKVVEQTKGPKLISFKFKRRKDYHRKRGHRQKITRLQVLEIQLNGETLKAKVPTAKPKASKPRHKQLDLRQGWPLKRKLKPNPKRLEPPSRNLLKNRLT